MPRRLALRSVQDRRWIAPILILCALLPFVPNLGGYFLSDDFVLLSWTRVTSFGEVVGFFDPGTFWFYRPLVKVVYWLGQLPFGLRAAPFHLFSLILHGASGYMVYRLAVRQGENGGGWVAGLAAALLFLLNPHHAETVSWIAAVGELMATLCVLISLILFQRFRVEGKPAYLVASLIVFVIGLLSRESAALLPVLLLFDITVLGRDGLSHRRRIAWALCAYALLLLGYFALQMLGRGAGQGSVERGGLPMRALNIDSILLGVMEYVHGLVPGGQLLAQQPLDAQRVVVWVEAALLAAVAVTLWQAGLRLALFGLLWMLFTPLLFVFFNAPTDRYFYLPSVGYSLLVAALLGRTIDQKPALSLPKGRRACPELAEGTKDEAVARYFLSGRMFRRAAFGVTLVVLLLTQTIALLEKESAWRVAGRASGGVVNDVRGAAPNPPDYAAFYFVELPAFLDGVPAFGNGLQEAVQLTYNNRTLTASAVTCEWLQSQRELPRYSYFFRFKGDGATQIARKEDCR